MQNKATKHDVAPFRITSKTTSAHGSHALRRSRDRTLRSLNRGAVQAVFPRRESLPLSQGLPVPSPSGRMLGWGDQNKVIFLMLFPSPRHSSGGRGSFAFNAN